MRALLDVNVLLALMDRDHIHHRPALAWWRNERDHGWASCPLTQNGFVRIACQADYPGRPTADPDNLPDTRCGQNRSASAGTMPSHDRARSATTPTPAGDG